MMMQAKTAQRRKPGTDHMRLKSAWEVLVDHAIYYYCYDEYFLVLLLLATDTNYSQY